MSIAAAFLGCDHRVGTSMICQSTAEYLAERYIEKKVLVIHAEASFGTDYSPCVSESMEHIRPYLAEKLIDVDSLCSKALWKKNIYVIAGPDIPGRSSDYFPAMSEYLIQVLMERFDFILCDCGAEIENGLALGAIESSDKTYLVMTQSEHAVRRYEWLKPLYRHIGIEPDGVVVNMFDRSSPYTKRYIGQRLGLDDAAMFSVKYSADGLKAETDEKSIYRFGDKGFCRGISYIAGDIFNEF